MYRTFPAVKHQTVWLALSQKLQAVSFLDIICDISDIIENIADQIQIMLINRIV